MSRKATPVERAIILAARNNKDDNATAAAREIVERASRGEAPQETDETVLAQLREQYPSREEMKTALLNYAPKVREQPFNGRKSEEIHYAPRYR